MGMMFLQSRMSPATVDNFQQKMMIYGLPLVFGVMSFFFPSGLTVYILTNTSLSLLHTLYMKKYDKGGKLKVVVPPPAASKPAKGEAKRIVDVEAEEVEDDDQRDADDDDDNADEAAAPAKAAPSSSKAAKPNAQRRKRKRKH
jgi:YidC/Oxa1 family membrane protein insertase